MTARGKGPKGAKGAKYRIRFVIDEEAQFEECNGEARPLTAEEYAENSYRACPDHPRAGSKVIQPAKGKRPSVVGCAVCGRTDYQDIPYEEYRAYYGNPDRHVYIQSEVQRQCPCCGSWQFCGGTGHIDFMDDAPELDAVGADGWYAEGAVGQIPGYLREIAREDIGEAKG